MDPTECMRLMQANDKPGTYGDALDHAEALIDWLKKGGFPPQNWERRAALRYAIQVANRAERHIRDNE